MVRKALGKSHTRNLVLAAVTSVCLAIGTNDGARADLPIGGLTIAVSPSGDRLVAGGDTRTLLVLDPKSLAVSNRVWIGTTIVHMSFDPAGQTLVVGDTDNNVHLFEAANWKQKATIKGRHHTVFSVKAGVLAGANHSYSPSSISIHALKDGAEKLKIPVAKGERIAVMGFDPDGKRLAVLFGPKDSKEEPKLAHSQIPKELRGLDRSEFQQKNDGKVSVLRIYDAADGKMLAEKEVYFSLQGSRGALAVAGDAVIVIDSSNLGARLTTSGEVKLFKSSSSSVYGLGMTADQSLLISGGMREFGIMNVSSLQGVSARIDTIPGWPEYFKGFSATADGKTIYGATSGFRVLRFTPGGKIEVIEPVR